MSPGVQTQSKSQLVENTELDRGLMIFWNEPKTCTPNTLGLGLVLDLLPWGGDNGDNGLLSSETLILSSPENTKDQMYIKLVAYQSKLQKYIF